MSHFGVGIYGKRIFSYIMIRKINELLLNPIYYSSVINAILSAIL